MGPFYAHLYLDAVPSQLLRETAPRGLPLDRSACNCPDPDADGEWASPAALRRRMRPLLSLIGGDAVPVLLDTVRAFEAWAATRPPDTDEPPRMVGGHATTLRGAALQPLHQPVEDDGLNDFRSFGLIHLASQAGDCREHLHSDHHKQHRDHRGRRLWLQPPEPTPDGGFRGGKFVTRSRNGRGGLLSQNILGIFQKLRRSANIFGANSTLEVVFFKRLPLIRGHLAKQVTLDG